MGKNTEIPTPLLSLRTIEKRYDIPQSTLRKMMQRGEIGYVKREPWKKQTMVRIPEEEIKRLFSFFPAIKEVIPD